jgi:hypothetical protein
MSKELGAGAWSYFGDPRAIHHDGHTFTGWISTTGNVWVADHVPGRPLKKQLIYKGLGRDDHNNPSLVFRRDGHIVVFFSPHSGRHLPEHQVSRMRYRISLNPYGIGEFGPVHTVDTNVPGGLGYTYPNPIQQRDNLWLFWRGGDWNPTFSYTRNGRDWVPARELVKFGHEQRPYAKYVGDGRSRIHGIFTDGHPSSWKTSLHYARYENSALYAANGRRLGTFASIPLHTSKLDHVYHYSDRGGRAWGHDIALDKEGRPYVVYTRRHDRTRDTFYYAYFNGTRWVSHKIVEAGPRAPSYTSGGATLDHEDPRVVYLSRRIGTWFQVEVWVTGDKGRTWTKRQLTDDPDGYSIRPVTPRGRRAGPNQIVFVRGDNRTIGYRDYRTSIHALEF